MNRPQGVDGNGVDTDALRRSTAPNNPNSVVLVPTENGGPLWQYANYLFLARRPDSVPLTDQDFLHQPLPLSTTKWWPEEGPAGPTPPPSSKAAEPSAPGVPDNFFDAAADYLGPDPLPSSMATVLTMTRRARASSVKQRPYVAGDHDSILGRDIGGQVAKQAPDATFVDFRGGIGAYLLGSVDAHMAGWLAALPDPLALPDFSAGPVALSQISLSGIHQIVPSGVTASDAVTLNLSAVAPMLSVAANVSFKGSAPVAVTISIADTTITGAGTMILPVAIPATDPDSWYVPYLGPLPYSYATQPFATTTIVSNGSLSTLNIAAATITVSGGNSTLDKILDLLIAAAKQLIETQAASAVLGIVNNMLAEAYSGQLRVA
jgi:hypothetical protein